MEEQVKDRLKALYNYTSAVENGDSDTVSTILHQASEDTVLERMLLEVNEVYQKEDGAVVHGDEVAEAQEVLLNIFMGPETESAVREEIGTPVTPLPSSSSREGQKRDKGREKSATAPGVLATRGRSRYRYRWQIAAMAVILIGLLVAVTPGTSVLANEFLALFRVQHIQPVNVDVSTPGKMVRELYQFMQNFGDIQNSTANNGEPLFTSPTSDLNSAQLRQALSFQATLPGSLPDGVGHVGQYSVSSQMEVSFVFNSQKARSYLASTEQGSSAIPTQLEGATFTLKLEPGLLVSYYDSCQATKGGQRQCSGGKSFAISEIPSPVLQSAGSTTLNDLRAFLLSLPKLPATERTILEHADVNSGTIPVPIPSEVGARQVKINGASGLLLNDGGASILTWQTKSMVYAIAALDVPADQMLATANTLH